MPLFFSWIQSSICMTRANADETSMRLAFNMFPDPEHQTFVQDVSTILTSALLPVFRVIQGPDLHYNPSRVSAPCCKLKSCTLLPLTYMICNSMHKHSWVSLPWL